MTPSVQIYKKSVALSNKNLFLFFAFLVFVLYGNSLSNGYSLDDELVTTTDRQVHPLVEQGIKGIPAIFTTNYAVNQEQSYEYRPLVLTSFAIEKTLFGSSDQRAFIAHFIQLLLYILLAIILVKTLLLLLEDYPPTVSLMVGVLFICLPIHTEVVNSLKNRDEIMSLLCSLLALRSALSWSKDQRVKHLIFVALFFLMAMLSKKTAMPFLVIIPGLIWLFKRPGWKLFLPLLGSMVVARIAFALLRINLVEANTNRKFLAIENPLIEMRFLDRIPVFFQSLTWYIKQSLLPVELHSYYGLGGFPMASFTSLGFYFSLLAILLLIGLSIYGLFKTRLMGIGAGLLFYVLCIGGAANLLFPMVGIVAERLVFSASLGLLMALVIGVYLLTQHQKIKNLPYLSLIPTVYIFYLTFMTIQRNPAWHDRLSLFKTDAKDFNSAKANALLGQEAQYLANKAWLHPNGNESELFDYVLLAEQSYTTCLTVYPNYVKVKNNLGSLYAVFFGQAQAGAKLSAEALALDPNYEEAHQNRLIALLKQYVAWKKLEPIALANNSRVALNSKSSSLKIAYHPAFLSLNTFEERGRAFLAEGMNPSSIEQLVSFAAGLERINPELRGLSPTFTQHVSTELNDLYSGRRPNHNILDTLRFNLCKQYKIPSTKASFEWVSVRLKTEILSCALIYKRAFPKAKVDKLLDSYFVQANDYQSIIDLHNKKLLAGKGNAYDCIQIGNAFINLGEREKALKALKKGYKLIETGKSRNKVSELRRLNQFIDSLSQH